MTKIEARRQELLAELAKLDELEARGTSEGGSGAAQQLLGSHSTGGRLKFSRSHRDLVLDALEEIGFMTYAQQLAMYIKARFGRAITPSRFGTLSVDEEKAMKRGGSRTVWLCHGLTRDRGEAVKRLWARSDWELERRIVTPVFGRAQYLRSTSRFANLAMHADEIAAEPDLLRFMAADHARDLGVTIRRGSLELEQWRALADKELALIAEKELDAANAAAAAFSKQLNATEQLFGTTSRPVPVSIKKQA